MPETIIARLVRGVDDRLPAHVARAMRQPGTARSVLVLVGGSAVAQGLTLLASPILTRLYNPAEFGLMAVFISVFAPMAAVACWRYEDAVPLPERDADAANLLALCLVILLGTSLLVGLGVWLLGDEVAEWVHAPQLRPYLWILPPIYLAIGTYQALSYWAVRKQTFGILARTTIVRNVGQIVCQVTLGVLSAGPIGLILGYAVAEGGGSSAIARQIWRRDRQILRAVSARGIRTVARRYRRFPLLSSGAALLESLGTVLPTLLLSAFFSIQIVGWFSLGQRVMAAPMFLLGVSIAKVYMAESAVIARADPGGLLPLYRSLVRREAAAAGVIVSIIAAPAPWTFRWFFGEEWGESGRYVQILGIMFFFQFVANPLYGFLNAIERQDLLLVREVTKIVLVAGAVLYGGWSDRSPFQTVALLSAAGSIHAILSTVLVWWAIRTAIARWARVRDSAPEPKATRRAAP